MQNIGYGVSLTRKFVPFAGSPSWILGLLAAASILSPTIAKAQGPVYSVPWVGVIDSGGGKSPVGTLTNHGSIGSAVATANFAIGTSTNRNGLIQVLFTGGATTDPDANNNGIPDAWEEQYFPGQPFDPEADSDGDGNGNRMEYISGTDPTQRSSRFRPAGTLSGTVYTMPLQTVAGRTYKVWVTRDLANWYLQETYAGDDTEKIFSFDETNVPSGPLHSSHHPSSYFFRVEVTLP